MSESIRQKENEGKRGPGGMRNLVRVGQIWAAASVFDTPSRQVVGIVPHASSAYLGKVLNVHSHL